MYNPGSQGARPSRAEGPRQLRDAADCEGRWPEARLRAPPDKPFVGPGRARGAPALGAAARRNVARARRGVCSALGKRRRDSLPPKRSGVWGAEHEVRVASAAPKLNYLAKAQFIWAGARGSREACPWGMGGKAPAVRSMVCGPPAKRGSEPGLVTCTAFKAADVRGLPGQVGSIPTHFRQRSIRLTG